MKPQVSMKSLVIKKHFNNIFYLLFCCIVLITGGCKKADIPPVSNSPGMNSQEKTLVGKWALKKTETYEITGTDSAGHYLCNLIASSTCDSACKITFKSEHSCPQYCPEFKGTGSISGCDSNLFFTWKAKQLNKLEIAQRIIYDIPYLTHDSVAFSNVYTKDILKLKSVVYYKRN